MKTHWRTAGLIAAVIMAGSAGQVLGAANLIQNGDFEEPVMSSSLAFFADGAVPGWAVTYSSSDSPESEPLLEFWNHINGWAPYSGSQHVELDGYDTVKISQTVATVPGKHYVLTYAWAPRPDVADNQMEVSVNGVPVASHAASGAGHSAIQWTKATYEFDAADAVTSIAFAEVGPNEAGGGVGMLLDAVSLTTDNAVQWSCSDGGNQHRYAVITNEGQAPLTWESARDQAKNAGLGWHLATISSAAEDAFILNLLNQEGVTDPAGYWLGGSQAAGAASPSDNWQWVTGEPWSYTGWGPGEPNDAGGPGSENYLHYYSYPGVGYAWNDIDISRYNLHGYVMEQSPLVSWADWQAVSGDQVTGQITDENGAIVDVIYSGVDTSNVQTQCGTDYWTAPTSVNPYTSAEVGNPPDATSDLSKKCDIVTLQTTSPKTLTFSQPVANLVFAVVSMNNNGYRFDHDFTILSSAQGYWGAGTLSKEIVSNPDGTVSYVLTSTGGDPHGTIQFAGTLSQLSWTPINNEYWSGFNIGLGPAPCNTLPTANAGANQTVVRGQRVCFDGSGSADADNDPLTYAWTLASAPAGSSAALDNLAAVKSCLKTDRIGTYTVSLTVNDGMADSAPSTASAAAVSYADALELLCPCAGPQGKSKPWSNHGQYVACVTQSAASFLRQRLITGAEMGAAVSAAAKNKCGVKP